jgi:hypothetical protein
MNPQQNIRNRFVNYDKVIDQDYAKNLLVGLKEFQHYKQVKGHKGLNLSFFFKYALSVVGTFVFFGAAVYLANPAFAAKVTEALAKCNFDANLECISLQIRKADKLEDLYIIRNLDGTLNSWQNTDNTEVIYPQDVDSYIWAAKKAGGQVVSKNTTEVVVHMPSNQKLKIVYPSDHNPEQQGWMLDDESFWKLSQYEQELINEGLNVPTWSAMGVNMIGQYNRPTPSFYQWVFLDTYFNYKPVEKGTTYSVYQLPGGKKYKYEFAGNKITISNYMTGEFITTLDRRGNFSGSKICNVECSTDDYSEEFETLPVDNYKYILRNGKMLFKLDNKTIVQFDDVLYRFTDVGNGEYTIQNDVNEPELFTNTIRNDSSITFKLD